VLGDAGVWICLQLCVPCHRCTGEQQVSCIFCNPAHRRALGDAGVVAPLETLPHRNARRSLQGVCSGSKRLPRPRQWLTCYALGVPIIHSPMRQACAAHRCFGLVAGTQHNSGIGRHTGRDKTHQEGKPPKHCNHPLRPCAHTIGNRPPNGLSYRRAICVASWRLTASERAACGERTVMLT